LPVALPPAPEFGEPLPVAAAPEVLDFLARRRSASAMTLRAPGPGPEDIAKLVRLATRVPDHGKLAPWRFVLLEGADKDRFAERLRDLALRRGDEAAAGKLAKLTTPPLAVAVVSSPKPGHIPEWEQVLSSGAVCATLLYAALAMGYGANWITDWYAYDPEAQAILGLAPGERVSGFLLIGTPAETPRERERADPQVLVTRWNRDA